MTDKDLAAAVHLANQKLVAEIKDSSAKIKSAQAALSHAVKAAQSAGLMVGSIGGLHPEEFDRILGHMVNSTINLNVTRVIEL